LLELKNNKFLFLNKLIEKNIFSSSDILFAKILNPKDEDVFIFLSYLFFISTKGNLTLQIDNKNILPSLIDLKNFEENEKLKNSIILGSQKINDELIFDATNSEKFLDKIIIKNNNYFYLQKNFFLETKIIKYLKNLLENKPKNIFNGIKFDNYLENLKEKKLLNENQIIAIENVKNSSISIITGGPGTGKTHLVKYLILAVLDSLNIEKKDLKIAICAPTGKAKSNLEEKISSNFLDVSIESKTLHSLLKINKNSSFKFNQSKLTYDLIIIDEASMIDAKLMAILLDQINIGTRAVLIGDDFQLSPVDAGNIFYELCNLKSLNKTILNRNMRFENSDLSDFSIHIKNKDENNFFKKFNQKNLKYFDTDSNILIKEKIFSFIDEHFLFKNDINVENAFENLSKFKILTSINLGILGTKNINELIFDYILSKIEYNKNFYLPIMITKNDYEKNLFNGEIGIYLSKNTKLKDLTNGDFYFFQNNEIRKYSFFQLKSFEIAFCISVHKSQGSEYENVLFYMPSIKLNFGNEILYTAATRSKKNLTIISDKKNLADVLLSSHKKTSAIKNRMANF
jgi:exodeoxyribonuclease V alpha subunit